MTAINDTEFGLLRNHLSSACGIEIPPEKRYLFQLRLSAFLASEGCGSFAELYSRLTHSNDRDLTRRLVQAMTTHETSFFRDGHPFELLRERLLPDMARRRLDSSTDGSARLRILSSGCSSGPEPYSIAMCVDDWLGTQRDFRAEDVSILALDVSRPVLAQAERGVYAPDELGRHIPAQFLSRYLSQQDDRWHIEESIRQRVTFVEVNMAENLSYLGQFDLIFCRNVLIYFSRELKARIVSQFQDMLTVGGSLLLGASESLYSVSEDFAPVYVGPSTHYVLRREEQPRHRGAADRSG